MKKELTYDSKITNIQKLVKDNKIPLKVEVWDTQEARDAGLGQIHPTSVLTKSKDFIDIALAGEDKFNDFACLEIVYGPNNQTIWHIDQDTCDPEISDFDYNEFIKYVDSLNKTR